MINAWARWVACRSVMSLAAVVVVAAASGGDAFPAKVLACYEVRQAAAEPVLDGVLDEPAWLAAAVADSYYLYWNTAAVPAELKTEFRMVYTDRGIFLGITNYDAQADKLRAVKATRDDPGLWQDDCAEIYVDPTGLTIGYTKFVVNALGTQGDLRRVDAAVTLGNWSGSGWQAKTGRRSDVWVIEAFFPWSDLGGVAKAGDFWRFCHVRYAYSSGKFQGATSSAGGNYTAPQNFGFLYFSPGGALDTQGVGERLAKRVPPPWALPLGDGFLVCSGPGRVEFKGAAELVERERATVTGLTAEVKDLYARLGSPAGGQERVRKLETAVPGTAAEMSPAGALKSLRELSAVAREADDLRWALKLQDMLEGM